ncbi:MAG: electron transport complex subunit RsxG [Zetaproteobacteria bacterium CG12_big_fil_rev_8_21_14_0_65_54_13]|nr:MAG: electron transport complex subunit RsxG [Zetaproteobacteria bacterium CG12_big_fil_rev_8_21_14_0_65_54_13]PJA30103.1 MAG: electron transport complex subunit RsxG [Zetaproteobacteria bacterium CG_4_9_14_3_um_filter_54_145]
MSGSVDIKQKMAYHPLLLGGIALIAGAMLVFADAGTRDQIAERQAEDLRASLTQVVADHEHDNKLLEDTVVLHAPLEFSDYENGITFYRARLQGKVVAVSFQVIAMGYSGAINIMMSVRSNGSIMGVRVISHAETPGLGDKIEVAKSTWIDHFSGLSLEEQSSAQWAVKKDGGAFDQFSGATITPRAVVRAVHKGLLYFKAHRAEILGEDATDD